MKCKPCWTHYGLTDEGAELAENALEIAYTLIDMCRGDLGLAECLIKEATYRKTVLPTLSKQFQEKYKQENGFGS